MSLITPLSYGNVVLKVTGTNIWQKTKAFEDLGPVDSEARIIAARGRYTPTCRFRAFFFFFCQTEADWVQIVHINETHLKQLQFSLQMFILYWRLFGPVAPLWGLLYLIDLCPDLLHTFCPPPQPPLKKADGSEKVNWRMKVIDIIPYYSWRWCQIQNIIIPECLLYTNSKILIESEMAWHSKWVF